MPALEITFSTQRGTDHGSRWLSSVAQEEARAAIISYIESNAEALPLGWTKNVELQVGGKMMSYRIYRFDDQRRHVLGD